MTDYASYQRKQAADVNLLIYEASQKIGFDSQTAQDLHRDLCRSGTHAGAYAAVTVQRALRLYVEADAIMKELGALAAEFQSREASKANG